MYLRLRPTLICCAAVAAALVSAGPALAAGAPAQNAPRGDTAAAWSIVASPNASGKDRLASVSCVSASDCLAIGWYATGRNPKTLAETWNGTAWSIVPSPAGQVSGVSCVSATDCTAVGYASGETRVDRWNGTKWSVVPSPNEGSEGAAFDAVSCVSATDCTAVGLYYYTAEYDKATLVESWNGTAWSVVPSPNSGVDANVLDAVSCVSASYCTAVGTAGDDTLVESWNGTAWSVVPSPDPGTVQNYLYGVSCVSATKCRAVGNSEGKTAASFKPLAEHWNGTKWSVVATPAAGVVTDLGGVSCTSAAACTAVGDYKTSSGSFQSLVESWNGTKWSVAATLTKGVDSSLDGVSCLPSAGCIAVGLSGQENERTLAASDSAGASS